MVNSQTSKAALTLANIKLLMLNAIPAPNNAKLVKKVIRVAIPLPSALLLAESHTLTAITPQDNA